MAAGSCASSASGFLGRAVRDEVALAHQGEDGERAAEQDQRPDQEDVVEGVGERDARRMEGLVVELGRRLARRLGAARGDPVGEPARRLGQQRVRARR